LSSKLFNEMFRFGSVKQLDSGNLCERSEN